MSQPEEVEAALGEVEGLLAQVGKALQSADAEGLQASSAALRNAALRFSQVLDGRGAQALSSAVAVRVRTVAARLASQRDALARLSVQVDRQVATVLPDQPPSATYGAPTSRGAGAARMYKSAG